MAEEPKKRAKKKAKTPSVRKKKDSEGSLSRIEPQTAVEVVPEEIKNALATVVDEPTLGKILSSDAFVGVFYARAYYWRGALPPPEILAQYQSMLPDAPERIFALAERQSAHRHVIEEDVIDSDKQARTRGQRYALIIALGGMSLATYTMYLGSPGYSLSIALGTLASMVAAFLKSGIQRHQEAEPPESPPASR